MAGCGGRDNSRDGLGELRVASSPYLVGTTDDDGRHRCPIDITAGDQAGG